MAAPVLLVANPLDLVTGPVSDLVGGSVKAAAGEMLRLAGQAVASALADACRRVAEGVMSFLDASSGVHLDAGWWAGERAGAVTGVVASLAAFLAVAFLLLALLQGLLAGDPGSMVRAVVRDVPIAAAGTVLLAGATGVLLRLTDAASSAVLSGAPGDVGGFLVGMGSHQAFAANGLLAGVVLAVFLFGGLVVWVELLVRSSLIYLLLAFAPLALAARIWPTTRGAFRRLCELAVALIVSKFAIALALALGAAALAGDGPGAGAAGAEAAGLSFGGLLAGASLMALAAFTPFVVLRLLPVVEAAVVAQGISRAPLRAGQAGMQGTYYAQGLSRLAAGTRAASAGAGAAMSGAGGGGGASSRQAGPVGANGHGPAPVPPKGTRQGSPGRNGVSSASPEASVAPPQRAGASEAREPGNVPVGARRRRPPREAQ